MFRKTVSALVLAAATAAPALADEVTGAVLAFDRVAGLIVLEDRSVFSLPDGQAEAPERLAAGDRVTISFQTVSDNGYGRILSIEQAE